MSHSFSFVHFYDELHKNYIFYVNFMYSWKKLVSFQSKTLSFFKLFFCTNIASKMTSLYRFQCLFSYSTKLKTNLRVFLFSNWTSMSLKKFKETKLNSINFNNDEFNVNSILKLVHSRCSKLSDINTYVSFISFYFLFFKSLFTKCC